MTDYDNLTAEQIIDAKAAELRCSMEVADYVIQLEKSLEKVRLKLDELWDDYRQR
ncbi:MAG: hypothetical protein U9Q70_07345 [Chloroflexota bacterium]|nr:hypothetical protein [Chloroflexota bacterium]